MTGKANPRTVPEEKERRNRAVEQAGRIRAYLPKLRAREEALRQKMTELTTLIADELRAYQDLVGEPDSTPEQIARRDAERAA